MESKGSHEIQRNTQKTKERKKSNGLYERHRTSKDRPTRIYHIYYLPRATLRSITNSLNAERAMRIFHVSLLLVVLNSCYRSCFQFSYLCLIGYIYLGEYTRYGVV